MKLSNLRHRATWNVTKGWVKKHRSNPGNQEWAVRAAIQYADKFKEDMVVVKGNSYGSLVYHIARTSDDLKKYSPGLCNVRVLVVKRTGEIFQANAE